MTESIEAIASAFLPEAVKHLPMRQADFSFSLRDIARFEAAMSSSDAAGPVDIVMAPASSTANAPTTDIPVSDSPALRALFEPLDKINDMSERFLGTMEALSAKPDTSPGDMLMAMVSVQKFMLQCQTASTVANRTSDGIQELFKQQS